MAAKARPAITGGKHIRALLHKQVLKKVFTIFFTQTGPQGPVFLPEKFFRTTSACLGVHFKPVYKAGNFLRISSFLSTAD